MVTNTRNLQTIGDLQRPEFKDNLGKYCSKYEVNPPNPNNWAGLKHNYSSSTKLTDVYKGARDVSDNLQNMFNPTLTNQDRADAYLALYKPNHSEAQIASWFTNVDETELQTNKQINVFSIDHHPFKSEDKAIEILVLQGLGYTVDTSA